MFPEGIKPIHAQLSSRGKPKSFALVERTDGADRRMFRYRAEFAAGPELYFTFHLDSGGKVAGLSIDRD